MAANVKFERPAIVWMFRTQDGRRNWTEAQRTAIVLKMKPVFAERGKVAQGKSNDLFQNSGKSSPPINTHKEIARAAKETAKAEGNRNRSASFQHSGKI
jgi:hypothetical protein